MKSSIYYIPFLIILFVNCSDENEQSTRTEKNTNKQGLQLADTHSCNCASATNKPDPIPFKTHECIEKSCKMYANGLDEANQVIYECMCSWDVKDKVCTDDESGENPFDDPVVTARSGLPGRNSPSVPNMLGDCP